MIVPFELVCDGEVRVRREVECVVLPGVIMIAAGESREWPIANVPESDLDRLELWGTVIGVNG
jgi:hypothetical protein